MSTILHPEIADIFRLYGPEYQRLYGDALLPSHQKTLQKIQHCRTPTLGGQVYLCSNCGQVDYSYHSCNDRIPYQVRDDIIVPNAGGIRHKPG